MTTITEQVPPKTPPAVTEAVALSAGWGRIAEFLTAHPEIAEGAGHDGGLRVLRCISTMADPLPFIASAAQACVAAGGRVEAHHSNYGGVRLHFGPVHIYVYADLDKVFSSRVTGVVEKVEYAPLFDLPQQDGGSL